VRTTRSCLLFVCWLGWWPPALAQSPLGGETPASAAGESRSEYSPQIASGRNAALAVVWFDSTPWESELRLLEITAAGQFSDATSFNDSGVDAEWPEVEISTRGALSVTWNAYVHEGGTALYGRSRLSGASALKPGSVWQAPNSEELDFYGHTLGPSRDGTLLVGILGTIDDDLWAGSETFSKRVAPTGEPLTNAERLNETRMGARSPSGTRAACSGSSTLRTPSSSSRCSTAAAASGASGPTPRA
jgi:hypothetical protein